MTLDKFKDILKIVIPISAFCAIGFWAPKFLLISIVIIIVYWYIHEFFLD